MGMKFKYFLIFCLCTFDLSITGSLSEKWVHPGSHTHDIIAQNYAQFHRRNRINSIRESQWKKHPEVRSYQPSGSVVGVTSRVHGGQAPWQSVPRDVNISSHTNFNHGQRRQHNPKRHHRRHSDEINHVPNHDSRRGHDTRLYSPYQDPRRFRGRGVTKPHNDPYQTPRPNEESTTTPDPRRDPRYYSISDGSDDRRNGRRYPPEIRDARNYPALDNRRDPRMYTTPDPRMDTSSTTPDSREHGRRYPTPPTRAPDYSREDPRNYPTRTPDNSLEDPRNYPTRAPDNSREDPRNYPTRAPDNSREDPRNYPTRAPDNSREDPRNYPTRAPNNSREDPRDYPTRAPGNSREDPRIYPTRRPDNSREDPRNYPTRKPDNSREDPRIYPTRRPDNSREDPRNYPTRRPDNSRNDPRNYPTRAPNSSREDPLNYPSRREDPRSRPTDNSSEDPRNLPTRPTDSSREDPRNRPTYPTDNSRQDPRINPTRPPVAKDPNNYPTDNTRNEKRKYPKKDPRDDRRRYPTLNPRWDPRQYSTPKPRDTGKDPRLNPADNTAERRRDPNQYPTRPPYGPRKDPRRYPRPSTENPSRETNKYPYGPRKDPRQYPRPETDTRRYPNQVADDSTSTEASRKDPNPQSSDEPREKYSTPSPYDTRVSTATPEDPYRDRRRYPEDTRKNNGQYSTPVPYDRRQDPRLNTTPVPEDPYRDRRRYPPPSPQDSRNGARQYPYDPRLTTTPAPYDPRRDPRLNTTPAPYDRRRDPRLNTTPAPYDTRIDPRRTTTLAPYDPRRNPRQDPRRTCEKVPRKCFKPFNNNDPGKNGKDCDYAKQCDEIIRAAIAKGKKICKNKPFFLVWLPNSASGTSIITQATTTARPFTQPETPRPYTETPRPYPTVRRPYYRPTETPYTRPTTTRRPYWPPPREYQSTTRATPTPYYPTQRPYRTTERPYRPPPRDYPTTQTPYWPTQSPYRTTERPYRPPPREYPSTSRPYPNWPPRRPTERPYLPTPTPYWTPYRPNLSTSRPGWTPYIPYGTRPTPSWTPYRPGLTTEPVFNRRKPDMITPAREDYPTTTTTTTTTTTPPPTTTTTEMTTTTVSTTTKFTYCLSPQRPENGLVVCDEDTLVAVEDSLNPGSDGSRTVIYPGGTICRYFCLAGYELSTDDPNEGVIVCTGSKWNETLKAQCQTSSCPKAPDIENTIVTCSDKSDEVMDNEVPEPKRGDVSLEDGDTINGKYRSDMSVCSYRCQSEYLLVLPDASRDLNRAKLIDTWTIECKPPAWNVTDPLPQCIPRLDPIIKCQDPDSVVVLKGKWKDNLYKLPVAYSADSPPRRLKTKCFTKTKTKRLGPRVYTCNTTDSFYGTTAFCKFKVNVVGQCPEPPAPPINGSITCDDLSEDYDDSGPISHTVGSYCHFACDSGSVIPASQNHLEVITCTEALQWNNTQAPSCVQQIPPETPACDNVPLDNTDPELLVAPDYFSSYSGKKLETTCSVSDETGNVLATFNDEMKLSSLGIFDILCEAYDPDLDVTNQCNYTLKALDVEVPLDEFTTYNSNEYAPMTDASAKEERELIKINDKCPELLSPANGDLECDPEAGSCVVTCDEHHTLHSPKFSGRSKRTMTVECLKNQGRWSFMDNKDSPPKIPDCLRELPRTSLEVVLGFNVSLSSCGDNEDFINKTKQELVNRNANSCPFMNCYDWNVQCWENVDSSTLNFKWTAKASFNPTEYESVDGVPEAETLIDQVISQTKRSVNLDKSFSEEIAAQGRKLVPNSFQQSKFRLVCDSMGFAVEKETDMCVECSSGTYHDGGEDCLPCPHGTYQDGTGATECKKCTDVNAESSATGARSKSEC